MHGVLINVIVIKQLSLPHKFTRLARLYILAKITLESPPVLKGAGHVLARLMHTGWATLSPNIIHIIPTNQQHLALGYTNLIC